MRYAILTDTDKVYVEFPEDIFRQMLKTYLARNSNDVDKAMDQIRKELKQLTITT